MQLRRCATASLTGQLSAFVAREWSAKLTSCMIENLRVGAYLRTGKADIAATLRMICDHSRSCRSVGTSALDHSADRKGEHPRVHLKDLRRVIHADGYAGFNELFVGNHIVEAACWAQVGRKFFDVRAANASPIAKEALERIGMLYEVEREIQGFMHDHRRRERQKRSKPIAARWPSGPTRPGASCRAKPSSPPLSATCGRAGPR